MKTLVFDIWADIGHFRKYYTTSSPLTFSFPSPPTIAGMLGAIIGSGKDRYLSDFALDQMYQIGLLNPVKKFRWGINYINTKDNFWQPVYKKHHEAVPKSGSSSFPTRLCGFTYTIKPGDFRTPY